MARLTPREFFEQFLLPSVASWRQDPLAIRLAKQAISELNNMAERVFRHWGAGLPEVFNAKSVREYRTWLAQHECSDFQLVWDIADAHKHVELGRPGRAVTHDAQTSPGKLLYGEALYGEGIYGGAEQLVVRLDDGSRRALSGVIGRVVQMWEYILARTSPSA